MLPEIFCNANDCACRPATAVVNASKIPMTCLQLAQRDGGGQPHSAPNAASRVPQKTYLISIAYSDALSRSGADLPVRGQKLPGRRITFRRRRRPALRT